MAERVESAARSVISELSSPLMQRSSSGVSALRSSSGQSPTGSPAAMSSGRVGESSRASISPGARAPSDDPQLMMRMMQQQIAAMVKNFESAMSRSLTDVSKDVLDRVTIMMSQRDVELTSRVDKMLNDAKRAENMYDPNLTLDDGTTLHDYAEDADAPLLSPSARKEGVMQPVSVDDERDEDEFKSEEPSEPVRDIMPDFALDRQDSHERRGADVSAPAVASNVPDDDDDESHLMDYVQWLKKRQLLYPFEKSTNARLYKPRHDLLSQRGRELEYFRFAFLVSWDSRLFGEVANRWFKRLLHDGGVADDADGKPPQSVNIDFVRVPAMSYDPRDRFISSSDGEGRDLPPNSYTLADLPAPLRVSPVEDAARVHRRSLQEEGAAYVHQRRLRMMSRGQRQADQPTCKRCNKPALVHDQLCAEHKEEDARRQQEADRRHEEDVRRAMERSLLDQRDKFVASSANTGTPSFAGVSSASSAGERYSISLSPYGTPFRDNVKNEAGPARISMPAAQSSSAATAMPRLDAWNSDYQSYDRVKQEEEVRAARHRREEYERMSTMTDVDKYDEATSVLGSIWSRAFTPEMRRMMRYSKLPPTVKLSGKDRITAVGELKAHGVTFSGERMKAAFYLRKLCTSIIRYDFTVGEVYQTMSLTMFGQAESWLQSEWY